MFLDVLLFVFTCILFFFFFFNDTATTEIYTLSLHDALPISFLAIRLANQLIHPVVFTLQGPQMAGSMFLTFCVSLAAMLTLAATLFHVELAGKRIDSR